MHPRDDASRPLTGVFATRSSDRPNPVGLHPVTVYGVDGLELAVGPLEAIDGTPVVDLKPRLREDGALGGLGGVRASGRFVVYCPY